MNATLNRDQDEEIKQYLRDFLSKKSVSKIDKVNAFEKLSMESKRLFLVSLYYSELTKGCNCLMKNGLDFVEARNKLANRGNQSLNNTTENLERLACYFNGGNNNALGPVLKSELIASAINDGVVLEESDVCYDLKGYYDKNERGIYHDIDVFLNEMENISIVAHNIKSLRFFGNAAKDVMYKSFKSIDNLMAGVNKEVIEKYGRAIFHDYSNKDIVLERKKSFLYIYMGVREDESFQGMDRALKEILSPQNVGNIWDNCLFLFRVWEDVMSAYDVADEYESKRTVNNNKAVVKDIFQDLVSYDEMGSKIVEYSVSNSHITEIIDKRGYVINQENPLVGQSVIKEGEKSTINVSLDTRAMMFGLILKDLEMQSKSNGNGENKENCKRTPETIVEKIFSENDFYYGMQVVTYLPSSSVSPKKKKFEEGIWEELPSYLIYLGDALRELSPNINFKAAPMKSKFEKIVFQVSVTSVSEIQMVEDWLIEILKNDVYQKDAYNKYIAPKLDEYLLKKELVDNNLVGTRSKVVKKF